MPPHKYKCVHIEHVWYKLNHTTVYEFIHLKVSKTHILCLSVNNEVG